MSNPNESFLKGIDFKSSLQQLLAFASLIVLFLFFSLHNEYFFSASNVESILLSAVVVGILALGSTFVIVTGGIDLSVGTVMSISAVMTGKFIVEWGFPIWLGVIGGIATGALCGLISGTLVARLEIPPFIATLGMMMAARGLALVFTDTKPIYFKDYPMFQKISTGELIPGLNNAIIVLFIAAIIAAIILSRTILGRYNKAIGSNEEAARLSGVNVKSWKMAIYTLTGAFSGLAGVMITARINSAQPATGMGYELDAIAAVVIGGTSLSGGRGTIIGTLIGALLMAVLQFGLRIEGVTQQWQYVVQGLVILLAVYADILRNRKKA